jgi:hypothetical protein
MTDITYINDGMFTKFFPETPAGETIWRTIAEKEGGNAVVFTMHAKNVIAQIRRAGYKVAKAKPVKSDVNAILAELLK